MPEITQQHRTLALETSLGPDVLLVERVVGHDALGSMFELRVIAVTSLEKDPGDDLIGTKVTLRLEVGEGTTRHFNGVVSQLAHLGFDNRGLSRYELVVVPWLWILTRTADCRIFQQKKVPEILTAVFMDAGFSDYELRLSGSYPIRDYCVQYRETDFNFVQRLMEHEGIYYFWVHTNGSHKMIICDAMSAHKPVPGATSLPYRGKESGVREGYTIKSWRSRQRITAGAYALNSFNFESPTPSPTSRMIGKSNRKHKHSYGDQELYDSPGDYYQPSDGERLAKVRCEEVQTEKKTISADSDARWLSVGSLFTAADMPNGSQNGEYLVTAISFQAEGGNYGSGTGSGEDLFSCTVSGIPKGETFRPARQATPPKVQGPQTAIVVGPGGEEIYTDKYGRVKVQFLWDRYGKADAGSSCWIRVSQPSAGKSFGGISIPRIGQEVIVDFLEGDPDRPIVTGRVYNAEAMPPYALPANATRSTFKSNSSKGGGGFNEIRMEDKKGSEQLFIHAEKNRDLRVKRDNFEYIGEEEHIIVRKDRFEQIDGDFHLKVGGAQNEDVGETASLKAGQHILQKAGMRFAQEAGTEVHIKGGMNVVIEAGVSLTLKVGGNFVNINPAGVAISGAMVFINSGGAAGSGGGCSPAAPKAPKEADKAEPGKSDKPISGGSQKPKGPSSPTATVLKQAARSGTPFCEICEKAKKN